MIKVRKKERKIKNMGCSTRGWWILESVDRLLLFLPNLSICRDVDEWKSKVDFKSHCRYIRELAPAPPLPVVCWIVVRRRRPASAVSVSRCLCFFRDGGCSCLSRRKGRQQHRRRRRVILYPQKQKDCVSGCVM